MGNLYVTHYARKGKDVECNNLIRSLIVISDAYKSHEYVIYNQFLSDLLVRCVTVYYGYNQKVIKNTLGSINVWPKLALVCWQFLFIVIM